MKRCALLVWLCLTLVACGDDDRASIDNANNGANNGTNNGVNNGVNNGDRPPARTQLDGLECAPDDAATRAAVENLYERTDDSVHELITCGGLQYQLSASFAAIILSSNPDFFDPAVLESIGPLLGFFNIRTDVPLTQQEDGSWLMAIPDASEGSSFELKFWEPGGEQPITADPFDMGSYLLNPQVTSTLTWEEMQERWSAKNHYTITYDGPGPLAGVLNAGEPLPEGQFELDLSLYDFVWLLAPDLALEFVPDSWEEPDFGPFRTLARAEMASKVVFTDQRGGVAVTYTATSPRDTVAQVAGSQTVGFDITALDATDGEHDLTGTTDNFRYVPAGLAGFIDYQIRGIDLAVDVRADFGNGARYPEADWRCPDPSE